MRQSKIRGSSSVTVLCKITGEVPHGGWCFTPHLPEKPTCATPIAPKDPIFGKKKWGPGPSDDTRNHRGECAERCCGTAAERLSCPSARCVSELLTHLLSIHVFSVCFISAANIGTRGLEPQFRVNRHLNPKTECQFAYLWKVLLYCRCLCWAGVCTHCEEKISAVANHWMRWLAIQFLLQTGFEDVE